VELVRLIQLENVGQELPANISNQPKHDFCEIGCGSIAMELDRTHESSEKSTVKWLASCFDPKNQLNGSTISLLIGHQHQRFSSVPIQ